MSFLIHSFVYPTDSYKHFLQENKNTYVTREAKGIENTGGNAREAIQIMVKNLDLKSDTCGLEVQTTTYSLCDAGEVCELCEPWVPPMENRIRIFASQGSVISSIFDNSRLTFNGGVNLVIL